MTLVPIWRASDRLAALPMYDLPELRTANDMLWQAIVARLTDAGVDAVPRSLTRNVPLYVLWRDQRLLLAQSCGYPLVRSLQNAVVVVATPRYSALGCEGSSYRSVIVVAATDRMSGSFMSPTAPSNRSRWIAAPRI